jgi:hypothetical protein
MSYSVGITIWRNNNISGLSHPKLNSSSHPSRVFLSSLLLETVTPFSQLLETTPSSSSSSVSSSFSLSPFCFGV